MSALDASDVLPNVCRLKSVLENYPDFFVLSKDEQSQFTKVQLKPNALPNGVQDIATMDFLLISRRRRGKKGNHNFAGESLQSTCVEERRYVKHQAQVCKSETLTPLTRASGTSPQEGVPELYCLELPAEDHYQRTSFPASANEKSSVHPTRTQSVRTPEKVNIFPGPSGLHQQPLPPETMPPPHYNHVSCLSSECVPPPNLYTLHPLNGTHFVSPDTTQGKHREGPCSAGGYARTMSQQCFRGRRRTKYCGAEYNPTETPRGGYSRMEGQIGASYVPQRSPDYYRYGSTPTYEFQRTFGEGQLSECMRDLNRSDEIFPERGSRIANKQLDNHYRTARGRRQGAEPHVGPRNQKRSRPRNTRHYPQINSQDTPCYGRDADMADFDVSGLADPLPIRTTKHSSPFNYDLNEHYAKEFEDDLFTFMKDEQLSLTRAYTANADYTTAVKTSASRWDNTGLDYDTLPLTRGVTAAGFKARYLGRKPLESKPPILWSTAEVADMLRTMSAQLLENQERNMSSDNPRQPHAVLTLSMSCLRVQDWQNIWEIR